MKISKGINQKAINNHTKRIFSISQSFPIPVIGLLNQKINRNLTQKQCRQIYQHLKEKNIFPILTNPKTLIDFAADLSIQYLKGNQYIKPNNCCNVVIEGSVKIFQLYEEEESTTSEDALITQRKSSVEASYPNNEYMIQKQKINIGEVLLFQEDNEKLKYFTNTCTTIVKIPYETYKTITMSTFFVQLKRKQQFFSQIPLFEKHYRSSLEDFVSSLEQMQCGFAKRIFSEGDPIEKVYIIKQGEFLLQKNIDDDTIIPKNKFNRHKPLPQQYENKLQQKQKQLKIIPKHVREVPYKIIGPKQILGDCQFLYNNKQYLNTMRCHKQGSVLYCINVQLYFKKLYTAQNGEQRANFILQQNFKKRKRQIDAGVKFNKSNNLILKIMTNSSMRHKTCYSSSKEKKTSWVSSHHDQSSSQRNSCVFFQKMNKTIINHNLNSIRKRNQSKNYEVKSLQKSKKTRKTPAIVQQVVHIVNQKKAYHRLRNLQVDKSGAFQFDINNVPLFIKKKYAHLLIRRSQ